MAEHGWPGHAVRLASTLFRYLDTGGHFAEAVTIHGHARHAARHLGDRSAEAGALHDLCSVGSAAVAATTRAPPACGRPWTCTGKPATWPARPACWPTSALPNCFRAGHRRRSATSQNPWPCTEKLATPGFYQARALGNLGFAGLRQGHYAQAARHLGESLALCREGSGTGAGRPVRWPTSARSRCGRTAIRRPHVTCMSRWPCCGRSATGPAKPTRWSASGSSTCGRAASPRLPSICSRPWPCSARPVTCPGRRWPSTAWGNCSWPPGTRPRPGPGTQRR